MSDTLLRSRIRSIRRDLATLQDAVCWRVPRSGGRSFAPTPGYSLRRLQRRMIAMLVV